MKNNMKVATVISYITLILGNIISIIYTPFMVSSLGKSQYGVFSLINTVMAYLTFLDCGLGDAVIRYNSKYIEEGDSESQEKINGMFIKLYLIISILCLVIGMVLYSNLNSIFHNGLSVSEIYLAKKLLIIAIFNIAISFPLNVYGGIILSYEKFTFSKILNFIRRVFTPVFVVIILVFGYRAIGMLIITTMLNVLLGVVNIWYCNVKLKVRFKLGFFDKSLFREIVKFSFYLLLGAIAYQIYWNTDQVILGMFVSSTAIAVFSLGNQFSGYYISFSNVISSMFLPKLTKLAVTDKSHDELMGILIKVSRIQMYIASYILIAFIIVGRAFIFRWMNKSFNDSYYLALIIMCPLIFSIVQSLFPILLEAMNKHRIKAIIYLLVSVVNLIISLILVKYIGYFGCAIGTSIGMTINAIANNIYYHVNLKLDMKYYWIQILKMLIPIMFTMLIGIIIVKIINPISYLEIGIVGILFSIQFLIICWVFSFNQYEKNILNKFLPAFIRSKFRKNTNNIEINNV